MTPGPFVDENGKVIGQHKGLANYTIGQELDRERKSALAGRERARRRAEANGEIVGDPMSAISAIIRWSREKPARYERSLGQGINAAARIVRSAAVGLRLPKRGQATRRRRRLPLRTPLRAHRLWALRQAGRRRVHVRVSNRCPTA